VPEIWHNHATSEGRVPHFGRQNGGVDRESLESMLNEGLSLAAIGRRVGRHESTVAYWVGRYGLRAVRRDRHAARGGACAICGYDRCPAALEFHHVTPSEKQFGLSLNGVARSLERSREEARKCVLLCSNCHMEVETGYADQNLAGKLA
jgi:hypothetical protein